MCPLGITPAVAQSPGEQEAIAERFVQVLLRRPQPGTALDRVYDFHVQNQTLDQFLDSLNAPQEADQAGAKQMVLGLIRMRQADLKNAITALEKADRWRDADAIASYQLARAYIAQGETTAAVKALHRAIDRNPNRRDAPDIFLDLGKLYARDGMADQAIKVWQQLIDQFPGELAIAEKVAASLAKEQHFDLAFQHYIRLAKQAKTMESKLGYQVKIAELHGELGQTDQSRKQLQSLLKRLRPGSWLYRDVRNRLERSYLAAGDFDALTNYYTDQANRSPDDLTSLVRLGQLLVGAGKPHEAEVVFRKSIERSPNLPDARLALAEILFNDGRLSDAAEQFNALLQNDPANPDYMMRLGEIFLSDQNVGLEQRYTAAVEIWNRLVDLRPDDAVTLAMVAKQMQSIDRSDRAIELYEQAIAADPQSPQYREYLGKYFHDLGRQGEAIEAWKSMAADSRRSRESLVRLADVFETFKQSELSLQTWRHASEYDLSFDQRLRYASVLLDAGKFDDSFAELETASALAQGPEERERLMRQRIATYRAAGQIAARIAEVSLLEQTADNQRLLALLFLANGETIAASFAIDAARKKSPDDINVLLDAAEIYQKNRQLSDAATIVETLVERDQRFQVNHLRRLIALRQRMGESDKALKAARQMINANPASTEPYRLYARIALESGQNEKGESMLRRAIIVDPRSVVVRVALAKHLVKKFKTGDAIELYWQAIGYEKRMNAKVDLIRQLVPLYARRGEVEQLVGRIENLELKALEPKSKKILIASVWESVNDFRQAKSVLVRLLSEHPRDVDALIAIVHNCVQSDDTRSAIIYQRRLVQVDDSEGNQSSLSALELKAGLITEFDATMQKMKATDDPSKVAAIIKRQAGEDPEQAVALCRVALKKNASLWDIRIILAQMLALSDGPDRQQHLVEADQIAVQIEKLGIDPNESPPATTALFLSGSQFASWGPNQQRNFIVQANQARPVFRSGTSIGRAQIAQLRSAVNSDRNLFPASAAQGLHSIQRLNRRRITSRHNSGYKSYSFAFGQNFIDPVDFFQAYWIARNLQVITSTEIALIKGKPKKAMEVIEERFPLPEAKSADVDVLRDALTLHLIGNALDSLVKPAPVDLVWRLAELDPTGRNLALEQLLNSRVDQRNRDDTTGSQSLQPLNDRQLEIFTRLCQARQKIGLTQSKQLTEIFRDLELRQKLISESHLAGKTVPPRVVLGGTSRTSRFLELVAEIQTALWANNIQQADILVESLVGAARESLPRQIFPPTEINWMVSPNTQNEINFVHRHRKTLIDAWLAHCSRAMIIAEKTLPPSSLIGGETVQVVVPVSNEESSEPSYQIHTLQRPLSKRLMSEPLARGLIPLILKQSLGESSASKTLVLDELIEQLATPADDATLHEQKLRRVVAAFACWWDHRQSDCFAELQRLADENPNDIDLQIEASRLAVVTQRSSKGLERLDRIKTFDGLSRIQVELARLILASQAGDEAMVAATANRLLTRPIDPAAHAFLANRLQALSIKNRTLESLQHAISQRSMGTLSTQNSASGDSERLRLAKSLIESGDFLTASEVAYSIINRRQSATRLDRSSERHQAIEILVQAGRLGPLIATMERKLQSASQSQVYRQELADLYISDGKPEKASKLWDDLIETLNLTTANIVNRANSLRGQRNFPHAALLYLRAFQREPELWETHWHAFNHSASMCTSQDMLFEELCKVDLSSLSIFSLCKVLRIRGAVPFTPSQRRFARRMVETNQGIASNLDLVLAAIPATERGQLPEIRTLMINVISSAEAFSSDSPLWALRGWSNSGAVSGVLEEIMQLLWDDNDAAKSFQSAATEIMADDKDGSRQIGQLLITVYELGNTETRKSATERIHELFPARFDAPDPDLIAGTIPSGLLWQVGQLLDSIQGLEETSTLQIGSFQAAIRHSKDQRFSTSSIASPIDQLFAAYAKSGRGDLARTGWLKRVDEAVLPKTTGIRENHELLLAAHVADHLLEIGYPVDAAGVCRNSLENPLVFRLARGYSQGRNHQRIIEQKYRQAFDSIDSAAAQLYLVVIQSEIAAQGDTPTINLLTTKLANASGTTQDCLFELAIRTALHTESGRDAVRRLLDQLAESAEHAENLSPIRSARLITAAVNHSDRLAEWINQWYDCLPSNQELDDLKTGGGKSHLQQLRNAFFAVAAIQRDITPSIESAADRFLDRLRQIAERLDDEVANLALSRLSKRPDAMDYRLDRIVDESRPGPLSLNECRRCLKIAKDAAEQESWLVAARALQIGLGSGPPRLENARRTNVMDSFGGQVTTTSAAEINDPIDEIRQQALSVLGAIRDQQGVAITSPHFNRHGINLSPEEILALDQALQKIVFPSARFVNAHSYTRPVLADDLATQKQGPLLTESLSYAVGNAARSSGTIDALIQESKRRIDASDAAEISAVFVDFAVTGGDQGSDTETLQVAIDAFARSIDNRLPRITPVGPTDTEQDSASNPILPKDTKSITAIADQIIRTLWPVLQRPNLSPTIKNRSQELLLRAAMLMRSNEEVQREYVKTIETIEAATL